MPISSNKLVVVVPFYNNRNTIVEVVNEIVCSGYNVIAVNDGSSDGGESLLKEYLSNREDNQFGKLQLVDCKKNKGKGRAILEGARIAKELGYRYMITYDGDGQHTISGLKALADISSRDGADKTIIIGSRMQRGGDSGSKFANKFSNFWLKLFTCHSFSDTQSGLRCYPVDLLTKMSFFSSRYEFEIEVLVRSAWRGFSFLEVPIEVIYPEDRVSHFRPIKDFLRISIINTIFTILTPIYGYPAIAYNRLKHKWRDSS